MAHKLEERMHSEVTLVHPDKSIKYAGQILKAVGIGCLVVVDENGPVGILTERDIVQKVVANGLNPEEIRVADVMSKELITLKKESTIEDAVDIMESKEIKKLPIIDNNHVVGIVTMSDMVKYLREMEKKAN
ncbi:MAG: CBS domain-containing protein [Candidatus Aenigmarchaeota archaeon]|nr:CBS domain-containing protein [Candidatus Aenigmarchaeota archaeon]